MMMENGDGLELNLLLQKILNNYNLEIFDIENTSTHGGSNRYFIKKKTNQTYKINKRVNKNFANEKKFGLHKISTYKNFAKKVAYSKIGRLEPVNYSIYFLKTTENNHLHLDT